MKKTKYTILLSKLRKEISIIESQRKKKRWKPHQKIMIDFINSVSKTVEFEHNNKKIVLHIGDIKKGFMHILLRHYGDNLSAIDIINIFEIIKRGIPLTNNQLSNNKLIGYSLIKKSNRLQIILKPTKDNSLIITYYSKSD